MQRKRAPEEVATESGTSKKMRLKREILQRDRSKQRAAALKEWKERQFHKEAAETKKGQEEEVAEEQAARWIETLLWEDIMSDRRFTSSWKETGPAGLFRPLGWAQLSTWVPCSIVLIHFETFCLYQIVPGTRRGGSFENRKWL